MLDFTFLTEKQIFGNKELEVFEKRGTIAQLTDFSILLGGYVSNNYYYDDSNLSKEDRIGYYWTSSFAEYKYDVRVVYSDGNGYSDSVNQRNIGARPALSYSSIRNIVSNTMRGNDGILEVEYGEYPQKAASKRLQDALERAYYSNQSSIRKTGKTYTPNLMIFDKCDAKFSTQIIEEYSFDDEKKYVRVKANFDSKKGKKALSNGEKYKNGDYVWVEVQPIKWLLIGEKYDILLAEKILFAGIPFNYKKYYKGDFQATDIKKYMDTIFSKDIIPSKSAIEIELKETIQKVLEEIIKILSKNNLEYETFIKIINAADNRRYISECMDRYFSKNIIPSNIKRIMPDEVISEKNKVKVKVKTR